MPTTVMVRRRISSWADRPVSVMRSPAPTPMASARPLPIRIASPSSAARLRPATMFCPARLTACSTSGSMAVMPTAKAPSRLLANPPVLIRREATTTAGWARAAARTCASSASGSNGFCPELSR